MLTNQKTKENLANKGNKQPKVVRNIFKTSIIRFTHIISKKELTNSLQFYLRQLTIFMSNINKNDYQNKNTFKQIKKIQWF